MDKSRYDRTREVTAHARGLRRSISKTEARLWPKLRDNQMGVAFRRQHPIASYFADYASPSIRLVIEVDGPLHGAERDSIRDTKLAEHGYDVLRFSVQDMDENFQSVIDTIYREVQLRLQQRQTR